MVKNITFKIGKEMKFRPNSLVSLGLKHNITEIGLNKTGETKTHHIWSLAVSGYDLDVNRFVTLVNKTVEPLF